MILKCDILKSRRKEKNFIKKFHYEVWLIEIKIDFSKGSCFVLLSVSLKDTRESKGVIEPTASPKHFQWAARKSRAAKFDDLVRSKFECCNKFSVVNDLRGSFYMGTLRKSWNRRTLRRSNETYMIHAWVISLALISTYGTMNDQMFN